MENIYYENSHGQKLCGTLSNVKSDTIILMCHGLGSNKDSLPFNILQDKINISGIATFRMDLLGHGESEGEFDDLTLTETIDDILCAKHELEKRGYDYVGFIGSSFGAVGGIMVASSEQFSFLLLISPPTHYNIIEIFKSALYVLFELNAVNKLTLKKKAHFSIKFFRDYSSHDSYTAAKKISAPVLIIQGDKDKLVPIAKSMELKKMIKGSKIKIFKGADHHYSYAQTELVVEIMEFIEKQNVL